MRELVAKMLKPSQNLYAQLLLLHAGAQSLERVQSTEEKGIRTLWTFLQRLGIPRREVMLEEGSGLSRTALVTPHATAALLQAMSKHEHAAIFTEALPEPGEGTLRRRLVDLKGKLRAKTGSLRFVNTLSGYLVTEGGERVVFSIMLNAYEPGPTEASARDEIDTIVRLLARFGEKAH
jgi:D-alanyl-D-alanine carboxypeptidase/D-alanyl-D-alanine-endopeptidase (penicillin-binding protein 4)